MFSKKIKYFLFSFFIYFSSCQGVNVKPLTDKVNIKLNGKWDVIHFQSDYSDFDYSIIPKKVSLTLNTLAKNKTADLIVNDKSYKAIKIGNTFHGSKEFAGIIFSLPDEKTDHSKYLFSNEGYVSVFYPNGDVVFQTAYHSIRLRKVL